MGSTGCAYIAVSEGYDIGRIVASVLSCGKDITSVNITVYSFVSVLVISSRGNYNVHYSTRNMEFKVIKGEANIEIDSMSGNIYEQYHITHTNTTSKLTLDISKLHGYDEQCMYGGIDIQHEVSYARYQHKGWLPVQEFPSGDIPSDAVTGTMSNHVGRWCRNSAEAALTKELNYIHLELGKNVLTFYCDRRYFHMSLNMSIKEMPCIVLSNDMSSYCSKHMKTIYSPLGKIYCSAYAVYLKFNKCVIYQRYVYSTRNIAIYAEQMHAEVLLKVQDIYTVHYDNDNRYVYTCSNSIELRIINGDYSGDKILVQKPGIHRVY